MKDLQKLLVILLFLQNTGETSKWNCITFTWSDTDKIWKGSKRREVTCPSGSGERVGCNAPTKPTVKESYTNGEGCGPCAAGSEAADCVYCAKGWDCNETLYQCYSYEYESSQNSWSVNKEKVYCLVGGGYMYATCAFPDKDKDPNRYAVSECGCFGSTINAFCKDCQDYGDSCNAPFNCIQGDDGMADPSPCTAVFETKCSKPKLTDSTGLPVVKYGCGACPAGTKDTSCEECEGEGCNTPGPGKDFKCYTHTFKDGEYSKTEATCTRLLGEEIKCNGPTDTSVGWNSDGCGGCAGTTESLGTCKECTGEELCNSVRRTTAATLLLLPLLNFLI